ncbi:MAG: Ig-like domain-containing protein [Gemmatimonadaceae bacterium]|nr:Ig-like domain-containing protein [Gemmatimonadaceae bacterium]
MSFREFRSVRLAALLAALAASALVSACSRESTAPTAVPTTIVVQAGNNQTAVAGQPLATPLSVVVTDAAGKGVKGYRVDWDLGAASGTLSARSSTTDGSGIATTTWTMGPTIGTARVAAQVNGLNPAVFTATVIAGPVASVVATPEATALGVGDTIRVRGSVRDAFGNTIAGQTITFTTLDASLASVSSTGLVTALAQGTARIVAAENAGKADTVPVSIGPAGSGACGTASPVTMTLGEVRTPAAGATSVSLCLAAPAGVNAEYGLALFNTTSNFGVGSYVDVLGIGNTGPTTVSLSAAQALGSTSTATIGDIPVGAEVDDRNAVREAEFARREVARKELAPLVDDARSWYGSRGRFSYAVATPNVGDQIKLNANASQACSNPNTRTGRVAAVSSRAMVVSDVDNPSGGYTDADYQGILATFDTLIFPMDTAAFGAPTNISSYGRIILFFTKAVNELTPRNANFTIGGFFFARDLYPKKASGSLGACSASNENEMFYLLVPDPNGEINGNKRTKDEVTSSNQSTIAHEFQHLINASRRLYVNPGAASNEETWLDEGLAHVAEELLYFRISGFGTRQNLGLPDVTANTTRQSQFNTYAALNFLRFQRFITATESNSPYAPNDSLSTRGATWNFLRFAAARQGAAGEAAFFRALVNSRTTGVANLQNVLTSGGFSDYLIDWAVSLIGDDFSTAQTALLDPRYVNPAWNFRSIFPGLRISGSPLGVYPISARLLTSSSPQRIILAGGTSSYVRFGIPAGRSAFITFSSNGQAPPAGVRWGFVRLR